MSDRMIITEEPIVVARSARYYIAGNIGEDIDQIWMLFHGYGQLASAFLNDCHPLLQDNVLLVAPEGLSRFYHRSGRGVIGASWMTSEDRSSEITDYISYLDQVWEAVVKECGKEPGLSLLGFSQGGATALRWGLQGRVVPQKVVLWGAGFPPAELEEHQERLKQTSLVMVKGEQDRIVSASEWESTISTLSDLEAESTLFTHSGGHELNSELLLHFRES